MRILLELRHPAHFHHFRYFIAEMETRGHTLKVLAVAKDVLVDLLQSAQLDYVAIGQNRNGVVAKLQEQKRINAEIFRICSEFRPDLLVGRPSPSITLTGWLMKIPRVIFAEDDYDTVRMGAWAAYPFATDVLAPGETDLGPFTRKKIPYEGYQKLAYLHPRYFSPDPSRVRHLSQDGRPFFLIRLARLSAHHDSGIRGISDDVAIQLIELLSARGRVHISAERLLAPALEPYRIQIDPLDIHHALFYCDLFIGDSQSMAFEAAMLGTPSIRYNSFAGRIRVLDALEHTYNLTTSVAPTDPERLFNLVKQVLDAPNRRAEWQARRRRMLADKIDVTRFMVWFVENYPESARIRRNDSQHDRHFRDNLSESALAYPPLISPNATSFG